MENMNIQKKLHKLKKISFAIDKYQFHEFLINNIIVCFISILNIVESAS